MFRVTAIGVTSLVTINLTLRVRGKMSQVFRLAIRDELSYVC